MNRVLPVLVCVVALCGEMKVFAAERVCTHKDMTVLAEQLNRGDNLHAIVEKLEALGTDYMIFVGDQHVSAELLERNAGRGSQPGRILVKSKEVSPNFLVQEDEILTLTFDSQLNLGDFYCKMIFTGP